MCFCCSVVVRIVALWWSLLFCGGPCCSVVVLVVLCFTSVVLPRNPRQLSLRRSHHASSRRFSLHRLHHASSEHVRFAHGCYNWSIAAEHDGPPGLSTSSRARRRPRHARSRGRWARVAIAIISSPSLPSPPPLPYPKHAAVLLSSSDRFSSSLLLLDNFIPFYTVRSHCSHTSN